MKLDLDLFRDILLQAESGESSFGTEYPCAHHYDLESDWEKYIHHLHYLVSMGFVDHRPDGLIGKMSGYFCLTIDGHEFLRVSRMPIISRDDYLGILSNSILTDLSNKIKKSENKKME